jgi:hypothetical protein
VLVLRRVALVAGGGVGDQPGDGEVGFGVGLAATGEPLERTPLLVLGVGVLRADPCGRLSAALLAPGVVLAQGLVVLGLLRRGADLGAELVGQDPAALVDLSAHFRALVEPLSDALGAHGGLVLQATGPHDPAEQSVALGVAEGSGLVLTVFCLFLPEMNALRPGRPTRGRRTCISVPSIRSLTACAPVWSPTHCG